MPYNVQHKKSHEEDLGGWLLPFTDMVVLLMAFFAISYAFSTGTPMQAAQIEQSMFREFSSEQVSSPRMALQDLREDIQQMLTQEHLSSQYMLSERDDGVILVAPSKLLFASGSDQLRSEALNFIGKVAALVNDKPLHVQVEGHTDSVPINTERFDSNWELSTARATQVVKQFIASEMAPERLSAVGFADTRPVTGEYRSDSYRHRRVVLRFYQYHTTTKSTPDGE